jgi:hypothetical protein
MRVHDLGGATGDGDTPIQNVSQTCALLAIAVLGVHCAPAIKRDLSSMPAGRVGFDDLCGLQDYFDRVAMKIGTPPAVVSSTEIQGHGHRSGRSRFAFDSPFQLQAVRQVLNENWTRLPDDVASAPRIELEVSWSERSGVRRVVTNQDAELTVARAPTALPYHVCLSELLFGEPLYHERRVSLGLGPLPSPPSILTAASASASSSTAASTPPDAGVRLANTSDGGGTGTPASTPIPASTRAPEGTSASRSVPASPAAGVITH